MTGIVTLILFICFIVVGFATLGLGIYTAFNGRKREANQKLVRDTLIGRAKDDAKNLMAGLISFSTLAGYKLDRDARPIRLEGRRLYSNGGFLYEVTADIRLEGTFVDVKVTGHPHHTAYHLQDAWQKFTSAFRFNVGSFIYNLSIKPPTITVVPQPPGERQQIVPPGLNGGISDERLSFDLLCDLNLARDALGSLPGWKVTDSEMINGRQILCIERDGDSGPDDYYVLVHPQTSDQHLLVTLDVRPKFTGELSDHRQATGDVMNGLNARVEAIKEERRREELALDDID